MNASDQDLAAIVGTLAELVRKIDLLADAVRSLRREQVPPNANTYSMDQACEVLGCKRSRIFQLLSAGTLERAPRHGRSLRVYAEGVKNATRRPEPKRRRSRRPRTEVPEQINPDDLVF